MDESINRSDCEGLIRTQTKHISYDREQTNVVRMAIHQSKYEEKMANNGLYIAMFVNFGIILGTVALIFLKTSIFIIEKKDTNGSNSDPIYFSFLTFNSLNINYSLFCVHKTPMQSTRLLFYDAFASSDDYNNLCRVDQEEDCLIDVKSILSDYNFQCAEFMKLRHFGVIVNILYKLVYSCSSRGKFIRNFFNYFNF